VGAASATNPASPPPAFLGRRGLLTLLLVVLLLLPAGCRPISLKRATQPVEELLQTQAPSGRLQEVAPPVAVQQLQAALAQRHPQVTIEAPPDGSTLPAGPVTIRVQARDWPLVDAGAIGLGPHLVVQIDDQPAIRLSAPFADQPASSLAFELPSLSPGSHRITAYAARPWGEAVKEPGAWSQIRVHRIAPNPLAIPQPGTAQLIAVSPGDLAASQPVLLDWLLLDAPLQGLRENDASWRLRVSVNGDSFLVDQNAPLWLQGWQPGSNSLLLELVDGRGEPLNPPFNSLVSEVVLDASGPKLAWQKGRLSDNELAQLLGTAPPEPPALPPTPVEPVAPVAEILTLPEPQPQPEPQPALGPEPDLEPGPETVVNPAGNPGDRPVVDQSPQPAQLPNTEPIAAPMPEPQRLGPSTSLGGSARSLVNPDGSLLRPGE
jgi:hypothetical protein